MDAQIHRAAREGEEGTGPGRACERPVWNFLASMGIERKRGDSTMMIVDWEKMV